MEGEEDKRLKRKISIEDDRKEEEEAQEGTIKRRAPLVPRSGPLIFPPLQADGPMFQTSNQHGDVPNLLHSNVLNPFPSLPPITLPTQTTFPGPTTSIFVPLPTTNTAIINTESNQPSIGSSKVAPRKQWQENVTRHLQKTKEKEEIVIAERCSRCEEPLGTMGQSLEVDKKWFHKACFWCDVCTVPLAQTIYYVKSGKYLCSHDIKNEGQSYLNYPFLMSTQPEKYQIAGYNIYPPPQISFRSTLDANHTIYIELIENETLSVIVGGFQTGGIQDVIKGTQTKSLNGLKLAKKGTIKESLRKRDVKPKNITFSIRFNVGTLRIHSRAFSVLSSINQIPPELRESVRPFATTFTSTSSTSTTTSSSKK